MISKILSLSFFVRQFLRKEKVSHYGWSLFQIKVPKLQERRSHETGICHRRQEDPHILKHHLHFVDREEMMITGVTLDLHAEWIGRNPRDT